MQSKNLQPGKSHIWIVVVVLFLALIGGGFWYFSQPQKKVRKPKSQERVMIDDIPVNGSENKRVIDNSAMMEQDDNITAMMSEDERSEDLMKKNVDEGMMTVMKEMEYQYWGQLFDVTEAQPLLNGYSTEGGGSGIAMSSYQSGVYSLLAEFENVPRPSGADFLEGWIVRKEPFNFISTGRVEEVDGIVTNAYTSAQDLSDYNFYVLTLEPDDGDPAPAEHILEGTMLPQ
jgi:hypothetical protein